MRVRIVCIAGAVIDKKTGELIVKLVNTSAKAISVDLNVAKPYFTANGSWTELTGANDLDLNTLDAPKKVYPTETTTYAGTVAFTLKARSVNVIKTPYTNLNEVKKTFPGQQPTKQ